MSVEDVRNRLSRREVAQWIAYDAIEPISVTQQIAVLCALFANAHRSKGRSYKPDDFIPRWKPKPTKPSDADNKRIIAVLHSYVEAAIQSGKAKVNRV